MVKRAYKKNVVRAHDTTMPRSNEADIAAQSFVRRTNAVRDLAVTGAKVYDNYLRKREMEETKKKTGTSNEERRRQSQAKQNNRERIRQQVQSASMDELQELSTGDYNSKWQLNNRNLSEEDLNSQKLYFEDLMRKKGTEAFKKIPGKLPPDTAAAAYDTFSSDKKVAKEARDKFYESYEDGMAEAGLVSPTGAVTINLSPEQKLAAEKKALVDQSLQGLLAQTQNNMTERVKKVEELAGKWVEQGLMSPNEANQKKKEFLDGVQTSIESRLLRTQLREAENNDAITSNLTTIENQIATLASRKGTLAERETQLNDLQEGFRKVLGLGASAKVVHPYQQDYNRLVYEWRRESQEATEQELREKFEAGKMNSTEYLRQAYRLRQGENITPEQYKSLVKELQLPKGLLEKVKRGVDTIFEQTGGKFKIDAAEYAHIQGNIASTFAKSRDAYVEDWMRMNPKMRRQDAEQHVDTHGAFLGAASMTYKYTLLSRRQVLQGLKDGVFNKQAMVQVLEGNKKAFELVKPKYGEQTRLKAKNARRVINRVLMPRTTHYYDIFGKLVPKDKPGTSGENKDTSHISGLFEGIGDAVSKGIDYFGNMLKND